MVSSTMIERIERWIIISLTMWAVGKAAYLQGIQDTYKGFAETGDEGTCYSPKGCK